MSSQFLLIIILLSQSFTALANPPVKGDQEEINYQDPNMKLYRKKSSTNSRVDLEIPQKVKPMEAEFLNPIEPETRSPAEHEDSPAETPPKTPNPADSKN